MARDVGAWLEGLGLGQYAELFAENDVDFDILHELADADLKDIGISLGHRKKLLKAIRDLGEAPSGTAAPAEPEQATEAERRRLTVMFCDMMGSTELSQKLDPEDYRDLLTAFQDACSGAVKRHQGHVAKHLGDGLLAYFG